MNDILLRGQRRTEPRSQTTKFGEVRTSRLWDIRRRTDRHTDYRRTDCNTIAPLPGAK